MAISVVNVSSANTSGFAGSLTIPITTPAAGNSLVVICGDIDLNGAGLGTVSCQDDQANTALYTRITGVQNHINLSGTSYCSDMYYRVDVPAGLTFITVTFGTGTNFARVAVLEVAGMNWASPLEHTSQLNSTTSGNPHLGTPISTTFTNALFVSLSLTTANATMTPITGWTAVLSGTGEILAAYLIGSGTQTPGFNGGNTVTFTTNAATFNPTQNPNQQGMLLMFN